MEHAHHHHHQATQSLNRTAWSATLHCLTGCAIGEVLGMVIGTALAWSNGAHDEQARVVMMTGRLLVLAPMNGGGRGMNGVAVGHEHRLRNVSWKFMGNRKKCADRGNLRAARTRINSRKMRPMPAICLRILAVALLTLVIPLQGMASVVAGQCMAVGHHDAPASHAHEDAHDGSDGHDHAVQTQADEGKSAHCGPCTACCASASIAGPFALSILHAASNGSHLFSQLAPPGVEPQRFDRPPLAL